MHVLWLIPGYHSFLVEELTALAPKLGRLSVISQAASVSIAGVQTLEIAATPRSAQRMIRRVGSLVRAQVCMPLPRTVDNWRTVQSAVRASEFIADYIRKERVDVVHSHFAYPAGTAGRLACSRRPIVLSLRGMDILTCESIQYGYCLDPFYRRTLKGSLNAASAITVASRTSRDALQAFYGRCQKTVVVPNGVELTRFNPDVSGDKVRGRLGLNGGPMILAAGNLVPRKGFRLLIDTIRHVRCHHPEVTAVIAGEGAERQLLEQHVSDAGLNNVVRLIGNVTRDEMPEYFAACDVFVHPSLSEGFGNVVLEAMAMKRPVVATRTGAAADLIKDGENGLAVPTENVEALAEAILSVLNNPKRAKELGEAAGRTVESGYSMRDRAAAFLRIYEEVTGKSGKQAEVATS